MRSRPSRVVPSFLAAGIACAVSLSAAETRPDLLLITLDTVRADEPGSYGGAARTPNLDRLAAGGVLFESAYAAAPLTLPAHATLLTGLDPVEHGLRDNGAGALSEKTATLAAELSRAGYWTGAVVGSRVLDRRFGLDRGFDVYDDRMAAERIGEFGWAERSARDVVDAALAAWRAAPATRPRFLWVHFYDAHAPYQGAAADERSRYREEIAAIDAEIGRLLAALERGRQRWTIAVGDHGESFGEQGEHEHGYLLHEPTLRVPLLVVGPGGKSGARRKNAVATRRIAATLAAWAGLPGGRLPGAPIPLAAEPSPEAIYHETEFPASTFGWAPLAALTRDRWRLVEGATPRLFDLARDPSESTDRATEETERVRSMRRELRDLGARPAATPRPAPKDEDLQAALRSLGYLSGATAKRGTLDPVEGLALLPDFEEAKRLGAAGDFAAAKAILARLVAKSPGSVPFLSQLAYAERKSGAFDAARRVLDGALAIRPDSEFLWSSRAELELEAGKPEEAERAFRRAIAANPRHLAAWIGLADLLSRSGRAAEEEKALREAVAAECESGVIHLRLATIALGRGDLAAADVDARRVTELLPEWPRGWELWAEVARRSGDAERYRERRARFEALAAR